MDVESAAKSAKAAQLTLGNLSRKDKDAALRAISEGLQRCKAQIFEANERDVAKAKAINLAPPLLKRLKFDDQKLVEVCSGIESLCALSDPVGRIIARRQLAEGMRLDQVSTPIGLIGMIFESRPDALIQIACLCLKSGNAVLLKGGREARETNSVLSHLIESASTDAGLPPHWIVNLETREDVGALLSLDRYIDLIIPRGSNEFVKYIMANSTIPVMGHADGICHAYIDESADTAMALRICLDSKTQYAAVCNAAETFLVHSHCAERILPPLKRALEEKSVEIRGCPRCQGIIACAGAFEEDWSTEYLDLIVSIKIVDSLDEAIDHINHYGSHHTDSIITNDRISAERFMAKVDSACVFWNASTRFADGYKFGLGAEVGISTSKLHARGPVGLEGLSIYKWKLYGHGDIVSDFNDGIRRFSHRELGIEGDQGGGIRGYRRSMVS